jgi:hypothetical protein
MLKRLFWPTIENQYDVDLVGQQGFWVCVVVGLMSLIALVVTGQPVIGALVAVTFLLGGMGVRERSIAAAVMVFLCYLLDKIGSLETGNPGGMGVVGLIGLMLLLANVRGTILSRRWKTPETPAEVSELPERPTESVTDKLSNVLPAKIWPVGRWIFFPMAGIVLALSLLGVLILPFTHK